MTSIRYTTHTWSQSLPRKWMCRRTALGELSSSHSKFTNRRFSSMQCPLRHICSIFRLSFFQREQDFDAKSTSLRLPSISALFDTGITFSFGEQQLDQVQCRHRSRERRGWVNTLRRCPLENFAITSLVIEIFHVLHNGTQCRQPPVEFCVKLLFSVWGSTIWVGP